MQAYYQLIQRTQTDHGLMIARYQPTVNTQGAWNLKEQHMAPVAGILSAELEQFFPDSSKRIGRLSFDILGPIKLAEFSIETRMIRAGSTIDLIEAVMQSQGKICVIARAWRMQTIDSSSVFGLEDAKIITPEKLQEWDGLKHWPGGFLQTIQAKAPDNHRDGQGIVWVSNDTDMIENQATSDFIKIMGMVDLANGVVSRQGTNLQWAFPNLDLQVHLHRTPVGQWLGIEGIQQFGQDGIGLSSAILHDLEGPFGRSEQILTLRPFSFLVEKFNG